MIGPEEDIKKDFWSGAFDYDHYIETIDPLIEDLHEEDYEENE